MQQFAHGFGVGIACKTCSVCLHAGIVQEANLSMVHLASNKASEQHTLWQVDHLHKPLYSVVQCFPCKHQWLTGSLETSRPFNKRMILLERDMYSLSTRPCSGSQHNSPDMVEIRPDSSDQSLHLWPESIIRNHGQGICLCRPPLPQESSSLHCRLSMINSFAHWCPGPQFS